MRKIEGEILLKQRWYVELIAYGRSETEPLHGLANRPSNNAKPTLLRQLFGNFVRANRTSNGKTQGTIRYFLNPLFKRIANTKKTQKEPDSAPSALSYHFNEFLLSLKNGLGLRA